MVQTQRSEEPWQGGGRENKTETVEETEADKVSELLFLQGPHWNVWGGAGKQPLVPEWRGWDSKSGGPGNGVWVPSRQSLGEAGSRRAQTLGQGGG